MVSGIESMPDGKRKRQYLEWIDDDDIEQHYEGKMLSIDLDISRTWGEIHGRLRRRGIQVAPPDGLIAATALQHGMHVVTRNVKDFEPTGVMIVNPWESG